MAQGEEPTVSSAAPDRRLANIDAMRAVAIISVMIYHYTTGFPISYYNTTSVPIQFPYGKFGVDLFFIVSAYCIFMTLTWTKTLPSFWARRLARLQPAYMAGIVLTSLAVGIFGLPGRAVSISVALGNVLWLDAIPRFPFVDGAYWSLIVELKFYFWLGLLFFAMRGRRIALAWSVFSVIGMSTFFAVGFGPRHDQLQAVIDQIMIATFAPTFLVGLIAYETRDGWKKDHYAASVICAVLLSVSPRFDGAWWLGLAIAAFAFVMFRIPGRWIPRPLAAIGLGSYSIYIIHQNVGLIVIRETAAWIPSFTVRVLLAAAIVIVLAAIIYATVEIRWKKPLAHFFERWIGAGFALGRRINPIPGRRGNSTLEVTEELGEARRW